jgi:hypothetical protein
VIGTGEAESSTARIRKITDEEGERELDILPDDLEVAEDVDARRSVDNSAKSEEAEQRTLSAVAISPTGSKRQTT